MRRIRPPLSPKDSAEEGGVDCEEGPDVADVDSGSPEFPTRELVIQRPSPPEEVNHRPATYQRLHQLRMKVNWRHGNHHEYRRLGRRSRLRSRWFLGKNVHDPFPFIGLPFGVRGGEAAHGGGRIQKSCSSMPTTSIPVT